MKTAREAVHRYSAGSKRAAASIANAVLHHWLGHDRYYMEELPPRKAARGFGAEVYW